MKKFWTILRGLYVRTLSITRILPITVRRMKKVRVPIVRMASHSGTSVVPKIVEKLPSGSVEQFLAIISLWWMVDQKYTCNKRKRFLFRLLHFYLQLCLKRRNDCFLPIVVIMDLWNVYCRVVYCQNTTENSFYYTKKSKLIYKKRENTS